MRKTPNLELYSTFFQKCDEESDINQLLPILKKYADRCGHITEMGVRSVVSTFAFMVALPKKLISYDIESIENFGMSIEWLTNLAKENGVDFKFILGDTTKIEIEETYFLFIDTLHIYPQLKKELELHANKVKKYIGFHDTTTFEFVGEDPSHKGLWPAIQEFLDENKDWVVAERFEHSNGLTILKKI